MSIELKENEACIVCGPDYAEMYMPDVRGEEEVAPHIVIMTAIAIKLNSDVEFVQSMLDFVKDEVEDMKE